MIDVFRHDIASTDTMQYHTSTHTTQIHDSHTSPYLSHSYAGMPAAASEAVAGDVRVDVIDGEVCVCCRYAVEVFIG